MSEVNLGLAVAAGAASFVSPCCLPLYPSYLSYITGLSVRELRTEDRTARVRLRILLHTGAFALGLSAVFYALGLGASLFGRLWGDQRELIRQLSAILMIVMGLVLLGLIRPGALMKERKLAMARRPAGYAGSFLLGVGFSAGWSPCVGPILSGILALSVQEPASWAALMTGYCLGFALPFLLLSFFIGGARRLLKYSVPLMRTGGGLMVAIGALLLTDRLFRITVWLQSMTPGWLKF
ncbi:cytochrome c biogenesis protein CcdA [Paenibacillus spiritus]|uniref:Cytochrome c biogenesis protein CcdA n=1 Tax=Paenibacillus spiritus TaxID=2496557 RepID=A0A5J5GJ34_9BACL|nr:cytochrome c biogenesis protein CcdA [Paenibacillus spiritus]KAA9007504.1 cytochrome c biogenesis protein CcdA [Paenibacillus spiritus]